MRTVLASCFALALVATASPSSADDVAVPAGWVRGAGLGKLPVPKERGWGSFQTNHEFTFPTRRVMPGARHQVEALPVVEIEPSLPSPPAELPEGGDSDERDLSLWRKGGAYRLNVRGFDIGFVQVNGSLPAAMARRSEGGAVGTCGTGKVVPVSYEGIRRVDRGSGVELVWGRGWLDPIRCRVAIVERHEALPEHLGGGVVYAFRSHCAACGDEARDVLHVITPQMGDLSGRWTPFEHHALALGPGRAAAIEGDTRFRGGGWLGLRDWEDAIDRRCGKDTTWCFKHLRVEVSQGRGEPSPTLFVSGDVDR